jgi:hypothetical protein
MTNGLPFRGIPLSPQAVILAVRGDALPSDEEVARRAGLNDLISLRILTLVVDPELRPDWSLRPASPTLQKAN